MNEEIESFLAHYGVKGMKWGVRKTRSVREEKVRTKRKKVSQNRRHLSDEDLNKYIQRLSNEKKLKDLVDADLNPGKTVAKKIMSESGQRVAKTVLVGAALLAIKTAVSRRFDVHDAVNYVAPRPKK